MVLEQYNCKPEILIEAVRKFLRKKILVIGDVMLDRFIWGSVSRISPEAPVPVVEIRKETTCLGGAANVAANIKSLGATPVPLGVVGCDLEGRSLREMLKGLGAPVSGLVADPDRATTIKTRIIAHHQQVCRTDREDKSPLSSAIHRRMVDRFRSHLSRADAVVVSDYAKKFDHARIAQGDSPPGKIGGQDRLRRSQAEGPGGLPARNRDHPQYPGGRALLRDDHFRQA